MLASFSALRADIVETCSIVYRTIIFFSSYAHTLLLLASPNNAAVSFCLLLLRAGRARGGENTVCGTLLKCSVFFSGNIHEHRVLFC